MRSNTLCVSICWPNYAVNEPMRLFWITLRSDVSAANTDRNSDASIRLPWIQSMLVTTLLKASMIEHSCTGKKSGVLEKAKNVWISSTKLNSLAQPWKTDGTNGKVLPALYEELYHTHIRVTEYCCGVTKERTVSDKLRTIQQSWKSYRGSTTIVIESCTSSLQAFRRSKTATSIPMPVNFGYQTRVLRKRSCTNIPNYEVRTD